MFRVDQVAATDATVLLVGRNRHGQGTARARHPPRSLAPHTSARRRQLRGAAGEPRRERALRPRARRVHRRACDADRPLRAGAPRHDPARRGRRAAARAPAQAAPRAAGRPGRAARQPAHGRRRRAGHCRDQPRPDRGSASGSLPPRPVLSAQRVSRSRFRRCAIGARTFRSSSSIWFVACRARSTSGSTRFPPT